MSKTSASEGLRAGGRKRENRGGGKRGRWSGGEGEQAKQRGGDPKSVVMPVEVFVGSRDL